MYDVIAMGELLIDFTMNGKSQQDNQLFEANPGGAPCNVLAMLSQLGKSTSFLGKVGKDQFGAILRTTLGQVGIDHSHLYVDETIPTTLAFVHTLEDGDRTFSFYRNPGADIMLTEEDVVEDYIKQAKIFHFGTLSMTHEGVRKATKKALKIAKENDVLISFDPNLREPLWHSLEEAKVQMEYGFSHCDILKISDNEIQFISGYEDYDKGIKYLQDKFEIPLIFLTLGKDGSRAYYSGKKVECDGFQQKNVVDTTGAGDTFCGCVLNYILEHGMEVLTVNDLQECLEFANAAAALITLNKGALSCMPDRKEILRLIQ